MTWQEKGSYSNCHPFAPAYCKAGDPPTSQTGSLQMQDQAMQYPKIHYNEKYFCLGDAGYRKQDIQNKKRETGNERSGNSNAFLTSSLYN